MKKLLIGTLLVLTACGAAPSISNPSPTPSPNPTNTTGAWIGQLTGTPSSNSVTTQITFLQTGTSLRARFYLYNVSTGEFTLFGDPDTETLNGSSVTFHFSTSGRSVLLNGTFSGTAFSGQYQATGINGISSGFFAYAQDSQTPPTN